MKLLNIVIFLFFSTEASNYSFREPSVSNEDILLASVLQAECGDCPIIDKHLIISSILNRCEDEKYPNNIDSILEAYSKTSIKEVSKDNLNFVIKFNKEKRDTNVLYFFNPKTATDREFIKKIRKSKKLIIKTKYHEYRGN